MTAIMKMRNKRTARTAITAIVMLLGFRPSFSSCGVVAAKSLLVNYYYNKAENVIKYNIINYIVM